MKVATRVVAMLAILASVSVANAATHVWMTAVPSGGGAGGGGGGQGQNLNLTCNTTGATSCTWTVTMMYQNDAGDEAIAGWANDLDVVEQGVIGKISIDPASVVYASNNFTSHPNTVVYGAGPLLEHGASGLDFGAGGQGGALATFTLRKNKTAGNTNTDHVSLTVGTSEWAGVFGDYPDMQAGANAPSLAGDGGGGAGGTNLGSVITITNTPEPASLALLGLGALALIRRRR